MSGFDVLTRGDVLDAALQARDHLVSCGVPAALATKDPRLWGRRAVDHGRLGWLDLPFTSRGLLDQIEGLVAEIRYTGLDHIVLIGLGAESLAAKAIMAGGPAASRLTVLDGGDTAALGRALERLDRTLVVLSSKSGVSLEGDAYRRILSEAFRALGMSEQEIAGRFLVITDHGSPLHEYAKQSAFRIGLTDPNLPGHFSALSAYGLVPAVLAGADAHTLLDEAATLLPSLSKDDDNPGLLLGAILGGCAQRGADGRPQDKLILHEPPGGGPLSAWITHLLACATGRQGRGLLAFEPPGGPGPIPDAHTLEINPREGPSEADTSVWAPLGAQFLLWQYAAAVAGWLMGVNPFEPAGAMAREIEDDAVTMLRAAGPGPLPDQRPAYVDGDIEIHADFVWPGGVGRADLPMTLEALVEGVPWDGYLSVSSYVTGGFTGREPAPGLARRSGRPVTYGTGPAHLHATAPVHLDGPGTGAFLIVSGDPPAGDPLAVEPVAGRPYSLARLRLARAIAETRALRRRGLPVVRLHLRDPVEGARRLSEAAGTAAWA
ncbi:phosphoheptose isomerase [Actinomadura sp. SCN-SB]|uniref:phosphoheptose isomerase n=1 Tax=Actinomadura sp. SCN-SB TaxID=3373092 RepID=UPI0037506A0C